MWFQWVSEPDLQWHVSIPTVCWMSWVVACSVFVHRDVCRAVWLLVAALWLRNQSSYIHLILLPNEIILNFNSRRIFMILQSLKKLEGIKMFTVHTIYYVPIILYSFLTWPSFLAVSLKAVEWLKLWWPFKRQLNVHFYPLKTFYRKENEHRNQIF